VCMSPTDKDLRVLDRDSWATSWACGTGARMLMLYRIALSLKSRCPAFLKRFNMESSTMQACLARLSEEHYTTLEKQCFGGGGHIPYAAKLKLSPETWKLCFREGRGCREAMLDAITAFIDVRAVQY
jgi:hypothetical protein